jgi:hypothetical protein
VKGPPSGSQQAGEEILIEAADGSADGQLAAAGRLVGRQEAGVVAVQWDRAGAGHQAGAEVGRLLVQRRHGRRGDRSDARRADAPPVQRIGSSDEGGSTSRLAPFVVEGPAPEQGGRGSLERAAVEAFRVAPQQPDDRILAARHTPVRGDEAATKRRFRRRRLPAGDR